MGSNPSAPATLLRLEFFDTKISFISVIFEASGVPDSI